MTWIDEQRAQRLQAAFRQMNRYLMVPIWRLGLGGWLNSWPDVGGRIMVLVHTGRKTGRRHVTPVNYALVDGDLYCVAGFGSGSDWYRNLLANPDLEVWLPDGWWAGRAHEIENSPDRARLLRDVLIGSGIVGPLFGLNPRMMNDEALLAATADYRLLHIERTEARTGPGGPGDLAWIWPLATVVLLALLLRRREEPR